jgi:hypothetical protein
VAEATVAAEAALKCACKAGAAATAAAILPFAGADEEVLLSASNVTAEVPSLRPECSASLSPFRIAATAMAADR